MDPITHSLTGIGLNYILNNKEHSTFYRKILAFSFVTGAVIPDIDFLYMIFGDTSYFIHHRGVSHSLIGLVGFPIIIALLFKLIYKNKVAQKEVPYLIMASFIGVLSHIMFDLLNSYGTMALWPISDKLYGLNVLPIVDIVILAILGAGLIPVMFKWSIKTQKNVYLFLFIILIMHIGFRGYLHYNVNKDLVSHYKIDKGYIKATTIPQFVGFKKWPYIAETKDRFIAGDIDIVTKEINEKKSIPRIDKDYAADRALQSNLGSFIYRLSPYINYEYHNSDGNHIVIIKDVRRIYYGYGFSGEIVLDNNFNVIHQKLLREFKY